MSGLNSRYDVEQMVAVILTDEATVSATIARVQLIIMHGQHLERGLQWMPSDPQIEFTEEARTVRFTLTGGRDEAFSVDVTVRVVDIEKIRTAIQQGYFVGNACPECQLYMLVQNGTCLKCISCGATTGCS